MQITRIETFEQYKLYQERNGSTYLKNLEVEKKLTVNAKQFTIKGISYPAADVVNFIVDYNYSNGVDVNWRERIICPITGLNNRLRACVHMAEFELGLKDYHSVYITEQLTPLYQFLHNKFPLTVGSEYLDNQLKSGFINNNGVRHEDMTRLSFKDEQFEFCLSFETLEHIPNYKLAFSEAYRILKKDGVLMWTVPFVSNNYKNTIRAVMTKEGQINHLLEPEYHGDPVNGAGILCFTHFGWEMLDEVREIGFKKVYAAFYWSKEFGYLGGDQIIFFARK